MSLKEPIVEGAYYERGDGSVVGPAASKGNGWWELAGYWYKSNGLSTALPRVCGYDLRCRVYIVPTDPAEVVAEIVRLANNDSFREGDSFFTEQKGMLRAADIVSEMMIGIKP